MRIDRVKLIAEMARQDVGVADLSQRATVSRATITALRGGKSCNVNSVRRVASALGVTVESLLEDCLNNTIRYPNMGTVKQAAEIYGLSPHYIRRLCKTGKVRYVNAGRGWLVNLDSLARYFEQGDPAPAEQSQTAHGIRQIG